MIPSGEKNKGFLGLNRTKVALFEETYPRHTNSTAANNSQNDVGVVSKNRQNAMFFGSLVFNGDICHSYVLWLYNTPKP